MEISDRLQSIHARVAESKEATCTKHTKHAKDVKGEPMTFKVMCGEKEIVMDIFTAHTTLNALYFDIQVKQGIDIKIQGRREPSCWKQASRL